MPELGKVGVGFERVAALVSQGGTVVGQGLLLLPDVQVDLLGAAGQHIGISLTVVEGLYVPCQKILFEIFVDVFLSLSSQFSLN